MKPEILILSANGTHRPDKVGTHMGLDLLELDGRAAGSIENPILIDELRAGFTVLIGDPANPHWGIGGQNVTWSLPFTLLALDSQVGAEVNQASNAKASVKVNLVKGESGFVRLRVSLGVDPSARVGPESAVFVHVWVQRGSVVDQPHPVRSDSRPVFVRFYDIPSWISEDQAARGEAAGDLTAHKAGLVIFRRSELTQIQFETEHPYQG